MSTEKNRRRKVKLKLKRKANLAKADVIGWEKKSDYHFQNMINGLLVNWYPSTKKIVILNETFEISGIDQIYEIVDMIKKGEK